jgi:hypothetical protein
MDPNEKRKKLAALAAEEEAAAVELAKTAERSRKANETSRQSASPGEDSSRSKKPRQPHGWCLRIAISVSPTKCNLTMWF